MEKILLVDDDEDFLSTIKFFLTKKNFTVFTATNGKDAIETVQRETPDLIILDIMMPIMGGIQTCHELKSMDNFKNIPIIVLSAKGRKQDVMDALSSGADDYIVKPFSFDELLTRIEKLLIGRTWN